MRAVRSLGRGQRLRRWLLQIGRTRTITGDDGRIVPTEQSLRLAGEIPGATLAVIPAAGHLPQEEKPDEFPQTEEEFAQAIR